jgi:hypothetical protein
LQFFFFNKGTPKHGEKTMKQGKSLMFEMFVIKGTGFFILSPAIPYRF